jgi:RNA-directed DNA polymerase
MAGLSADCGALSGNSGKTPGPKFGTLKKLGIAHKDAVRCGNARKKHWRMSRVKWVIFALPNRYFFERGWFPPAQ